MLAYIQYRRGLPATEGCYSVWCALEDRGWEIRTFEAVDEIELDADHPVVGGVDQVVDALARLGITPPDIDYPSALRAFLLDPEIETRTMGWVRRTTDRWPLFVKPTTGRKEFTGVVVHRTDDLIPLATLDDSLPVFVARPVDLRNRVEWRAFVVDGDVRDIRPYTGCVNEDAPSPVFVRSLVQQWHSPPVGCSVDIVNVGDRARPDWRLIECNDGYSLGSYGLQRSTYAELIVKRWAELSGGASHWP